MIAIVFFALGCVLGCVPAPNTEDIDNDIASLEEAISLSEGRSNKFSAGNIKTLIGMQLEYQKATLAALEMKKHSLIYFSTLNVDWKGFPPPTLTDEDLARLQADIDATTFERNAAQEEADRYLGGLLKSVALMRVATHDASLAALNFRKLTAKWGIPVLSVEKSGIDSQPSVETKYYDDEAL